MLANLTPRASTRRIRPDRMHADQNILDSQTLVCSTSVHGRECHSSCGVQVLTDFGLEISPYPVRTALEPNLFYIVDAVSALSMLEGYRRTRKSKRTMDQSSQSNTAPAVLAVL